MFGLTSSISLVGSAPLDGTEDVFEKSRSCKCLSFRGLKCMFARIVRDSGCQGHLVP